MGFTTAGLRHLLCKSFSFVWSSSRRLPAIALKHLHRGPDPSPRRKSIRWCHEARVFARPLQLTTRTGRLLPPPAALWAWALSYWQGAPKRIRIREQIFPPPECFSGRRVFSAGSFFVRWKKKNNARKLAPGSVASLQSGHQKLLAWIKANFLVILASS